MQWTWIDDRKKHRQDHSKSKKNNSYKTVKNISYSVFDWAIKIIGQC